MVDNYDAIMIELEKISKILGSNMKNYKYYNANPNHIITGDCVIRSISVALNKKWDDVLKDLTNYSIKYKHFINCEELYEIYLKDHRWRKHTKPHKKNGKEYSLGEWLEEFGDEAIVTIGDNHLTYVNKHVVYDIWDCTDGTVEAFWTKKKEIK